MAEVVDQSHGGPAVLPWQQAFLQRERLPAAYLESARRWFDPLAARLRDTACHAPGSLIVGINGSQGSGKSTLAAYLAAALEACDLSVANLSLDDFYLPREAREGLARAVHPLLKTRGVPGTHDMTLLEGTLDHLAHAAAGERYRIPRFDKARDDRCPEALWPELTGAVDVVLLEGWCLGAMSAKASEIEAPINALERSRDSDLRWRLFVERALRQDFEPLYPRIQCWVMLRAPSFDCVLAWRTEQERKLAARAGPEAPAIMNDAELRNFVDHYQRLTERCLSELPARVRICYDLGPDRGIIAAHGLGD